MPIEKRTNFFSVGNSVVKEKKERKQRIKKPKLTRVEKKVEIIKNKKLGKFTGAIGVQKVTNAERWVLILRVDQKDIKKRQKIIGLFSCADLEFIKQIGDKLSEDLKFPYNPTVTESQRVVKSKTPKDEYEVNHSMFKEYDGKYFIFLDFGTIWLEDNNEFCTKRNYEKLSNGQRIFEMYGASRFTGAFIKCRDLLTSYNEETQCKILKEVSRFGCFEDKNSVRVAMGLKPIESVLDETGNKFIYREIGSKVIGEVA
jgi:hypothetical protein